MSVDCYSKRFCAALVVSCLLHAAPVFLPALGAFIGALTQGGKRPGQVRVLSATLVAKRAPEAAAPVPPVSSASTDVTPTLAKANEEPPQALNRTTETLPLPIPAPTYYTADQLTKHPQLLSPPPTLDVAETGMRIPSGKVILKLWINESGEVISVDIEESNVPDAISAPAVAAFSKLRFVPGEINERPVGSLLRIEVTYDDAPDDASSSNVP